MKICEYGCGKESNYPPTIGRKRWCCSKHPSQCSEIRRKNSQKNKGKITSKKTRIKLGEKRKGKRHSELSKRAISKKLKERKILEKGKIYICSYGCSQKAKYQLCNKKYCCSKYISQCPEIRRRNSQGNIGRYISEENKKLVKKINKGKKLSIETKMKISSKNKLTIKQIKERYPFFSKIEEMRYNPDKLNKKEIQVHCKNYKCKNSKENNNWFTPTYIQLYERIRQLEKDNGNGGSYFYCSEECKSKCILYNLIGDPYKNTKKYYNQGEYQIFIRYVLERENNLCEYCSEPATDVHHIRPQKLEPFFALDPDFAIAACKKCHYEKGHKKGTECSTGNLAQIFCN